MQVIQVVNQSLALVAFPLAAANNSAGILSATVMTGSGTLRNLYVTTQDPQGSGTTTVTIFQNGVATLLSVTIAAGRLSGADTTDTVSYVAGDIITYIPTLAAGSLSTSATCSVETD